MRTTTWKFSLIIRRIVLISIPLSCVYTSFTIPTSINQVERTLDEEQVVIPPSQFQQASSSPQFPKGSSQNSFINHVDTSACLLVMDDNHFLIEWIAYHYHTTMLRNLIVAIDPRSSTSPLQILERWNAMINVTVWNNDSDYVTSSSEYLEAETWVSIKFANDNPSRELIRHRARQRLFYFHCMQEHKRLNRGLTLLLDTDEFVRINYETARLLRSNIYEIPPIWKPASVLKLVEEELKLQQLQSNISESPCIQIPRLRFGATDTSNEFPPGPFDASTIATLRWKHHASSSSYQHNRISKTIVDLHRIKWDDLHPVESIHRPLSQCSRRKLHIRPSEQLLIIHHYLGSWEQYSFRNDARTGNERSEKMFMKSADLIDGRSTDIVPWLAGFVQDVGLVQAQRLLADVGQVPEKAVVK